MGMGSVVSKVEESRDENDVDSNNEDSENDDYHETIYMVSFDWINDLTFW